MIPSYFSTSVNSSSSSSSSLASPSTSWGFLNRERQRPEKERPWECDQCFLRFHHKCNLANHKNQKHKILKAKGQQLLTIKKPIKKSGKVKLLPDDYFEKRGIQFATTLKKETKNEDKNEDKEDNKVEKEPKSDLEPSKQK